MKSGALTDWLGSRAAELDRIESVHRFITGESRGRRWNAEHLNCAYIARIVAEFQGFCRDLHDEAVEHVVDALGIADPGLRALTRAAFTRRRMLVFGNPSMDVLKKDFRVVDVDLAKGLRTRVGFEEWQRTLDSQSPTGVLLTRNAIVHSDDVKLSGCRTRHLLTKKQANKWRGSLSRLASGMDAVVEAELTKLTGSPPW